MEDFENIRVLGEVIFWNGSLGFIKFQDFDENIFFHLNSVDKNYNSISLLDKVSFKIRTVKIGKHIGKTVANNVKFISRGNFSDYQKTIGVLRDWNGRFGFLDSPQIDKSVFLFHSRLINSENEIQNGEYLTFSPIKSSKNPDQLFAFFAYPLQEEKDIDFLRQQESQNDIIIIKELISKLILERNDIPVDKRFELELEMLLNQEQQNLYNPVSLLIKQYDEKFEFVPSIQILKKHLNNTYLVQLWENDVINSYDLEVMMSYFHNASADTKRVIISRFPQDDKAIILRNHFDLLIRKGKVKKSNNDLKTYLGIVHKNKETQELEIYEEAKKYILDNLTPQENVSLWLNDYIDDLPEKYIIDNFDIKNVPSTKEDTKYSKIIKKIYENYLLSFTRDKNFDEEYPKLIKYLQKFKEQFENDFGSISKASIAQLNKHQKFILWIFEPSLDFDAHNYFENYYQEINIYFLLKYLIRGKLTKDVKLQEAITSITEAKLIEFAREFQWNDLIVPVNEENAEYSFLKDIKTFIDKFDRNDIDLLQVSEAIYDSIEFYKVYHLRLWLFNYVAENRFDYIGYRESFKDLTYGEQEIFRIRGNHYIKDEVFEGELLEVEPCQIIVQREGETVTYKAFVENIYFRDGSIMLRLDNREYTEPFSVPFASFVFNRILKSNHFNSLEFFIDVKEKKIINIEGLEEIFNEIQTGEIEKALGEIIKPSTSKDKENEAYVEDWKLRKEVIDYLNEHQINTYSPKIINEPKNRYRRLDKNVEIESYEKTLLYSIQTADGYGIVWENIDLTEDRATFIFKATEETYLSQIDKIASSIVSYGQFRSTLVSAREEEKLSIFKDNLGFITKIHKQRGKNLPFGNWLRKLNDALEQPIPKLPNSEQVESLSNWQADMPFKLRVNKKIKKINLTDIKTVDFNFEQPPSTVKTNRVTSKVQVEKKLDILNKLKEINQLFQN